MALVPRHLSSRRKPQNGSVSTEPANNESVVPTGRQKRVLPQSGTFAVLSSHNGKYLRLRCRGLSIESLLAPGGYMHAPLGKVLPGECALCALFNFDRAYGKGPPMLSLFQKNSYTRTSEVRIEYHPRGERTRSETGLTVLVLPGDPALDFGIPAIALTTNSVLGVI